MKNFTNKELFSGGYIIIKYYENNKWGPGQIKTLVMALLYWIIYHLKFPMHFADLICSSGVKYQ